MDRRLFRKPRWIVAFFDVLDRLPIPGWTLAVLTVSAIAVAHHLAAWRSGVLEAGQFHSYLASLGVYFVSLPFVWTFLAKRAARDLRSFFSDAAVGERELYDIIRDFNSLPDTLALGLILPGTLAGYLSYQFFGIRILPMAAQVLPFLSAIAFAYSGVWGFAIFARALRQALLMARLYDQIEVDPFNPDRIYSLARYGVYSAVTIFLLFYILALISIPAFIFTPFGALTQSLIFIIIGLLFLVPLAGVNRRLVRAKEVLVSSANDDLREIYARIHSAAEAGDYAAIRDYRDALSTLRDSKNLVEEIPTWPWPPNTPRNILAPLLLPTIVFVAQLIIERLIGG